MANEFNTNMPLKAPISKKTTKTISYALSWFVAAASVQIALIKSSSRLQLAALGCFCFALSPLISGFSMSDSNKELLDNTASKKQFVVYIGTNTNRADEGVYSCRFSSKNGQFTVPQLAVKALNPNFIAIHPDDNFLYTVGDFESSEPKMSGCVSAFSMSNQDGKLTLINQVPSCGQTPCHIIIDKTGKYALVSNYSTGNLSVLPVGTDGHLLDATTIIQHTGSGSDPSRQQAPHIHSINLDFENRFAIVADLGLDKIMTYRFNTDSGALDPNAKPYISLNSGSGPRHFAFHPNGRYGYIINEIGNTITAFDYNPSDGTLLETQTISTIPNDYKGNTYTSEIQVHPSGKYLYGSNRGHDSIAVFKVDKDRGTLTLIDIQPCGGKWPRHFCIDPTGNWMLVANERSNQITLFGINEKTGKLTKTDHIIDVPSPVCIKFAQVYDPRI